MTEEERRKHNAHRLAAVLYQYSEDEQTIKRLAPILAYNAGQLQTDMQDLIRYIWVLEERTEERDGD